MKKSATIFISSLKVVLVDFLMDLLQMPFWWYSQGLVSVFKALKNKVTETAEKLGISVWLRNFFVPMFGQYDIAGRLISAFIRFFQIIFRSIFLFTWIIFATLVFIFYLILPIAVVFFILVNLNVIKF